MTGWGPTSGPGAGGGSTRSSSRTPSAPPTPCTLEVGGAQETVAQVGWDPNDPFQAIWAPCWRMVADPQRPERSRWQAFTGQSGNPASTHYDDLQPDWVRGATQPMAGEGPWAALTLEPDA